MSIIIAVLAMFVGLIALWLASANLKKIELGQKELKLQLTSDIEKVKRELEKKVDGLNRKVATFDGKMEALIEGQTQTRETIANLENEVAKVNEELNDLVLSLPPQLRQPRGDRIKSEFG